MFYKYIRYPAVARKLYFFTKYEARAKAEAEDSQINPEWDDIHPPRQPTDALSRKRSQSR